MRTSRRWTDDEDAMIAATMHRQAADVAAAIGRTLYAVEQRRSRLFKRGAVTERGRHPGETNRTWTAEEDAVIAATLRLPSAEVVPLIPNHTRGAILLRRRDLRARGVLPKV